MNDKILQDLAEKSNSIVLSRKVKLLKNSLSISQLNIKCNQFAENVFISQDP